MKDFEYFEPATIEEARRLLREGEKRTGPRAVGTGPVTEMRSGKSRPERVIDLKAVRDLNFLRVAPDGVRIGALYRVRDAGRSKWLRDSAYGAICRAAGAPGSPRARNEATIVGSLCSVSPSADLVPPLIALAARAKSVGHGTGKKVAVERMFLGPARTAFEEGEVITGLEIPCMPDHAGCSYYRPGARKSLDLPVAGVAVMVRTDPASSTFVGAVAPAAMRARKAEAVLKGARTSQTVIVEVARVTAEESKPVDDVRASVRYRRRMVEVAVRRGIVLSLEQARARRR